MNPATVRVDSSTGKALRSLLKTFRLRLLFLAELLT